MTMITERIERPATQALNPVPDPPRGPTRSAWGIWLTYAALAGTAVGLAANMFVGASPGGTMIPFVGSATKTPAATAPPQVVPADKPASTTAPPAVTADARSAAPTPVRTTAERRQARPAPAGTSAKPAAPSAPPAGSSAPEPVATEPAAGEPVPPDGGGPTKGGDLPTEPPGE
jgi:hypothetical protein